jgi:transposase
MITTVRINGMCQNTEKMSETKRVSKRYDALLMRKEGKSLKYVANQLGVSESSIIRWQKRKSSTGSLSDLPKSGRPATVNTPRNRKRVRSIVEKDPFTPQSRIAKKLGVSRWSVRNMVQTLEMHVFKPFAKPAITKATQKKRYNWAMNHRRDSKTQWENTLFTDEKVLVASSFNPQNQRLILKDPDDPRRRMHMQSHELSIMVWAGVTATAKMDLIVIPSGIRMNANAFIANVVRPGIAKAFGSDRLDLFPNPEFARLLQDSAPCHQAKSTILELEAQNIPLMDFPPSSPDLNCIENVWSMLMTGVQNLPTATTIPSLIKTARTAWAGIQQQKIANTVDSMNSRIRQVLAKGGKFTEF